VRNMSDSQSEQNVEDAEYTADEEAFFSEGCPNVDKPWWRSEPQKEESVSVEERVTGVDHKSISNMPVQFLQVSANIAQIVGTLLALGSFFRYGQK